MPLTGDGVDKVVHTEETWNQETEDMEPSVLPDDPPPPTAIPLGPSAEEAPSNESRRVSRARERWVAIVTTQSLRSKHSTSG